MAVNQPGWTTVAERGSFLGMWFTAGFYRFFGRRLTSVLVLPIVTYFFITDRRGRRASRQYLERLHASPAGAPALSRAPGPRDVFRHYREFALAVLDRLRFALGEPFEIVVHGREQLDELVAARRGAILLGAHLGSFDALRALAAGSGVAVNIVMLTRYARHINHVLRRLNAAADVRVIERDPGSLDSVFRLKACVERGEFVAILGDRATGGARSRVSRVSFLGALAPFPQGPFVLAHALACPVVMIAALRRGPHRYDIFAEILAERVHLPRPNRETLLCELIALYASRLEAYCRLAPYQWFNFFDFWQGSPSPPVSE